MKLIRHYRGQGTESDEEMVRKAGGIIKRTKAFLAKQYDALQHIDFREKTNRTILKIVIINYIILAIVCFPLALRNACADYLLCAPVPFPEKICERSSGKI